MATFIATVTFEVTIEVQCPDSKLKNMLTDRDFTEWVEDAIANAKASGKENYVSASCDGVDVLEITEIEKENGATYEWDGEKLTKDT
jgi:3-deoxy-D-manno-octulosonic acid (KDO) 8-phosphate synthase